jgi:hypothetical protein
MRKGLAEGSVNAIFTRLARAFAQGAGHLLGRRSLPIPLLEIDQRMSDQLDELPPDRLLGAARRIAELLDGGHAAALWTKASLEARNRLSGQDFAEGVRQLRTQAGIIGERRQWVRLSQANLPASETSKGGVYGTVVFEIALDDDRFVHELLTFRRDEDDTWRFAGYSLQPRRAPRTARWLDSRDATAA